MRLLPAVLALLLVCGVASSARAQTPIYPRGYDACSAGDGGVIVAWEDSRYGERNIYAQRMSPLGARVWADTGAVVCAAAGHQLGPRAVPDGIGGAYVVWADFRSGTRRLYAQRIDANGAPQWAADGEPITTTGTGPQSGPLISVDATGGLLVAWSETRTTVSDAWVQRIDRTGALLWGPGGAEINADPVNKFVQGMVADGAGGTIVLWFGNSQFLGQRLDAAGATQWGASGVQVTNANPTSPNVAGDGAGGASVSWFIAAGTDSRPYIQHLSAAGALQWGAGGLQLSNASGYVSAVVPASDGSSGVLATWTASPTGTGSVVTAQRVDTTGALQWAPGGVALSNTNGPESPQAMARDAEDGMIVAWTDYRIPYPNSNIWAQRIGADGTLRWDPAGVPLCTATGVQLNPVLISDGVAGATCVWQDFRAGMFDSTLYAVHIDGNGHSAWPTDGVRVYFTSDALAGVPGAGAGALRLGAIEPNPCHGRMRVSFSIPAGTRGASLVVEDVFGRRVMTPAIGAAGRQVVDLETRRALLPGVYFVRLMTATGGVVRKVCVLP